MHFKVIFNLDGSGLVYDPGIPIHLDSLLAWCLAPHHRTGRDLNRDDIPDEIPLPLLKHHINGDWVWQASALFPEGKTMESLQYWRKRFRQSRVEMTNGSPNLTSGIYRDYNNPLPVLHTLKMCAYASGNRKEVKRLLRNIKSLGKKRAYGKGVINDIELIEMEENHSLVKDKKTMRWLPDKEGPRLVRPRPPYWNPNGRVACLEVGSKAGE